MSHSPRKENLSVQSHSSMTCMAGRISPRETASNLIPDEVCHRLVIVFGYLSLQAGLPSRKGNKRIKSEDLTRLGGTDRNVSSFVNRDASVQDVVDVSSLV